MIETYRGKCPHTSPDGVTNAGRVEWEKHVKAEHTATPYRLGRASIANTTRKHSPLRLSKLEREWLGKYVTVWGSPQVWQVWSLSPTGVWLVRNGKTREARIQDLVERATPQSFEDVAFNFEGAA